MSQKIKQASLASRFGTGLGQGLAEQLPKEIAHQRHASGLKSLADQSGNLNPAQFLAKAASTYGATPQEVQSFSEIAKQQGLRNSLRGNGGQEGPSSSPDLSKIKFANLVEQSEKTGKEQEGRNQNIPSGFQNREEQAKSQPGIVKENPTAEKFVPRTSWTPNERDNEISRVFERNPYLSYQEAAEKAADNEKRELAAPIEYQEQQKYLKEQEDKADAEFDEKLKTTLQGNPLKDVTGETQIKAKKAMRNDLATNPNLTINSAAEKWVGKTKDFVNIKNQVREKANRDIIDRTLPSKKEETLKSLKEAQKRYDEMGDSKEFYNMLKSGNTENSFGFNMSPGGAALIAYPRSDKLKNILKSTDFGDIPNTHIPAASRKLAEEFGKNRTSKDSVLAFVRNAKDRIRFFDERACIDYLRENQDEYNLTPDQREELITGVSDLTPDWGDLAIFPLTGRSVAHD